MSRVVSSGAMRPQDLIPTFLSAVRAHSEAAYRTTRQKYDNEYTLDVALDDDHPFWCSDECAQLLEDLFEDLSSLAPDGTFFGAHPGDGTCYGFWDGSSIAKSFHFEGFSDEHREAVNRKMRYGA